MYQYPLKAGAWQSGLIIAAAQTMPAAARRAFEQAYETRGRRRKPWLHLPPPPPGITFADLAFLHRGQIHAAVAKAIGKKGGNFAASLTVDLGLEPNRHDAVPCLIVATTRWRAPNRLCDRIDVAAVPCSEQVAGYYGSPADPEVARWTFDRYAAGAPYKVVLDRFGGLDSTHPWGIDWSCRR